MNVDLPALVRRVGKYRRATFTAPRIDPTVAQRTDVLRIYMRLVRGWQERFHDRILPAYERSLSELVTDDARDLQFEIGLSERQMAAVAQAAGLSVDEWIKATEGWHRRRFAQAFNPTGVNIGTLLDRGDVTATLEAALGENVALIRSLNDQMRNDISGEVFRALQNRTTARDLARAVRKRAGVGQSRAELIAADQLQKLTGALDEQRQRQVGIAKFEWAHSGKANPRQEHLARDGKTYAWTDPVAKTDPPGRAIRCGCRARAVLEIDEEVNAATEPAPAPPPPPPPRRGFRSPVNPGVNDETISVRKRLAVQKEMTAEFAEAAKHPGYDGMLMYQNRNAKDYGRASFSAEWNDEAVSAVAAFKPELDDLADQLGLPRLRGFKTTASAHVNASQGGGVMSLNASEFNARAARVGGGSADELVDKARAEMETLVADRRPFIAEMQDIQERLIKAPFGSQGWRDLYDRRDKVGKKLSAIDRKRKKLSQVIGRGNRVAATPKATWKPGDDVKVRPWSAAEYYDEGVDRIRSTLFHEFAHHVHQTWKREGGVRPLENRLAQMWRDRPRDIQPSTYGTANQHEWFAENFSLFVMGKPELVDPELRKLIKELFDGDA